MLFFPLIFYSIIMWWRCGYWLPTNHKQNDIQISKRYTFFLQTTRFRFTHSNQTQTSYIFEKSDWDIGNVGEYYILFRFKRWIFWNEPQLINLNARFHLNIFNSVVDELPYNCNHLPFIRLLLTPLHLYALYALVTNTFLYFKCTIRMLKESNKFGSVNLLMHLIRIEYAEKISSKTSKWFIQICFLKNVCCVGSIQTAKKLYSKEN